MPPKSSKKKTPAAREFLDIFLGHIPANGEVHVAKIVAAINETESISTSQLESALKLFADDDRFVISGEGYEAKVSLVDQSAPAGEPEEIKVDGQVLDATGHPAPTLSGEECRRLADDATAEEAQATQEERRTDPTAGEQPSIPPATGEAAPIPTIGEALAQHEATAAKITEAIAKIDEVLTDDVQHLRLADEARAKNDKEANEKRLAQAIEALDSKIETVGADLKATKDRRKVLQSELMASILGHTQTSLGGDEAEDHDEPEDTPLHKAISGQAPMIVEPPVAGMIRKQGAEQAIQGRTELDCPYSREKDARAVSMWFDGFREAKREDHSEREAIVQALTREQLVEKCLPHNGILPPGEDTPKVVAVEWDKRPHLVLDMLADGEGPTAGVERWALLPLFKRDEWSSGEGCPAMTYGDPIGAADKSDEAKAVRIKGGIDCAKLAKVGRAKLVVGPLQLLSIATVKTAAKGAEEQPPY